MACPLTYADAFDYSTYWMCESLEVGTTSAGVLSATLADATKDFTTLSIPVGSPVYNFTRCTYGRVVTVAATEILTTTTWNLGDVYQIAPMEASAVASVETFLRIGASDITMSLVTVGAVDCAKTLSDSFLRKLNIVLAAVMYKCPCARPNLEETERMMFLQWAIDMLTQVRNGEIELCDGETGSHFPAFGIAQQSWTAWRAAEIMLDSILSG